MTMLFLQYLPGDSDPCTYCTTMLTWDQMLPSGFGHPYRENVCADCRAEEEANGGWMITTPVKISERLERKKVLITNVQDDEPERKSWGQRLRARFARAVGS